MKDRKEVVDIVRELERRAGRRSVFYMAKYMMGRPWMVGGKALGWSEHHVELGQQLWGLHMSRGDRKGGTVLKIEWARDTRKSTFAAAYAATALHADPNERILLDSDTQPNAAKKMGVIKEWFESEYCQELYGDLRSDPWTNNTIQIKRTVPASDASVTASGTETGKTSQHYTIAIPDDKQSKENSQTPEAIEKVHRDYDMYGSLMVKKYGEDGREWGPMIVPCGTVWGENDLFKKIDDLAADDQKYGRPRMIFSNRKGAFHTFLDDRGEEQDYRDRPMFPDTLPLNEIIIKESRFTDQDFAYNYLLRRISKATQLFHKEQFVEHALSMGDLAKMRVYTTIDPAGLAINPDGKKEGHKNSDDCVVMTTAVDEYATLYCLEYVNKRMDREELLEEVKRQNRVYDGPWRKGTAIETRFLQHELKAWLMLEAANPDRGTPIKINWMPIKQDKRTKRDRISALQPYAKNRKLRPRAGMTEYVRQFTKYPSSGVHDDIPDAQAMVLDIMKVPGKRTEAEKWGSPAWWETQREQGVDPKTLPAPEDIKTWRMVARIKDRAKRKGNRILH